MTSFPSETRPLIERRVLRPGGLFVFLEPETVGSADTVELVSRIFPTRIKSNSSSPGRKSRSKDSTTDSPGIEEVAEVTRVVSTETPEAKDAADRVAIVSQRLDTLFVPYITGIAVRP